jgi:hypothetical protein
MSGGTSRARSVPRKTRSGFIRGAGDESIRTSGVTLEAMTSRSSSLQRVIEPTKVVGGKRSCSSAGASFEFGSWVASPFWTATRLCAQFRLPHILGSACILTRPFVLLTPPSVNLKKKVLSKLQAQGAPSGPQAALEIESWLQKAESNTRVPDEMDAEGSGSGLTWHRGEALENWEGALKTAHRRLMDSSTRLRLEFLNEELLALAKHGGASLLL